MSSVANPSSLGSGSLRRTELDFRKPFRLAGVCHGRRVTELHDLHLEHESSTM